MKCGKQGHYIRNCQNQSMILLRNIKRFKGANEKKEFKGTQECKLRHFAFCYNNNCLIHKEAKYNVNYWLQELSLEQFRGIKEENKQDRLWYGTNIHRNDMIENPVNSQDVQYQQYTAMAKMAV